MDDPSRYRGQHPLRLEGRPKGSHDRRRNRSADEYAWAVVTHGGNTPASRSFPGPVRCSDEKRDGSIFEVNQHVAATASTGGVAWLGGYPFGPASRPQILGAALSPTSIFANRQPPQRSTASTVGPPSPGAAPDAQRFPRGRRRTARRDRFRWRSPAGPKRRPPAEGLRKFGRTDVQRDQPTKVLFKTSRRSNGDV